MTLAAEADVASALRRFESLHPEKIDLSLGRIEAVLETLGRPQDRLPPVIHVAGTNGKGSVCAFLRAMCEAAGLRVHVFTSPHLVRFNERIRLAGELVGDAALIDWLERTYAALRGRPITHFEATTAAALLAFAEIPADILILEVGLGGRYDATNVIEMPGVSVITPVDIDHKQFLGDTIAGIAFEKAGVVKPGATVVMAEQSDEAAAVIETEAARLSAPLRPVGSADHALLPDTLSLKGAHQFGNAATAAAALKAWGHPAITDAAICEGAQTAQWPARLQVLSKGPLTDMANGAEVWLDGGHNPHAARAIAALLGELAGETTLVCAMMASKDHVGFLEPFAGVASRIHACPNAQGHANASPDALALAARRAGLPAAAHESFEAALIAAAAGGPARILICGSLYLAGEVLSANDEAPD